VRLEQILGNYLLFVCCLQVMDIQRAISARLTAFTFEGTDMQLKWSAW
jgi:dynein heavy chain